MNILHYRSHIRAKKKKKSQINNLHEHIKNLEKEQQMSPKRNRSREIVQMKAEINNMETKKAIQGKNENRSWFFERISKISWPFNCSFTIPDDACLSLSCFSLTALSYFRLEKRAPPYWVGSNVLGPHLTSSILKTHITTPEVLGGRVIDLLNKLHAEPSYSFCNSVKKCREHKEQS